MSHTIHKNNNNDDDNVSTWLNSFFLNLHMVDGGGVAQPTPPPPPAPSSPCPPSLDIES